MPPKPRLIRCEICGNRSSRMRDEKRMFMARFPKEENRCRQWVKAVGKEDLIYVPIEKLHTLKYVCGNHFEDKDFNMKKSRLDKYAVPSKNLRTDPLSDEMLLEFPCHIKTDDFITDDVPESIYDNEDSLSQVEATAGPSNSEPYMPEQQLTAQRLNDKKLHQSRNNEWSPTLELSASGHPLIYDHDYCITKENITNSVTQNVTEAFNEKMRIIMEENNNLKKEISNLKQEVNVLKNETKKNNLVFFGIEEKGKTECQLVDCVKEIIISAGTHLDSTEISNIYRIGKRDNNKNRAVVVSITTLWKIHQILRNKSKLPEGIYVKKDYSKEVMEKIMQLQLQLEEEKKKGNTAYIRNDKLIIKQNRDNNPEKRKREESKSPMSSNKKKRTKLNRPTSEKTQDHLPRGIHSYLTRKM